MRNLTRSLLLLGVSFVLVVVSGSKTSDELRLVSEPDISTTTTDVERTTTTTTQPIVADTQSLPRPSFVLEVKTGTELEENVDYADPVSMSIPAIDVFPEIEPVTFDLYNSCGKQRNPCKGMVDWWYDDQLVGPCENGPVDLLGHGNKPHGEEEPFFNLVDDEEFRDDSGLTLGEDIFFYLEDGTVCQYSVIEPMVIDGVGVSSDGMFIWYLKGEESTGGAYLNRLVELIGDEPILMLNTSYAGPRVNGFKETNGYVSRIYNAVLFAELVGSYTPRFETPLFERE